MFYKSTWNTSIQKHFSDFNENYGIGKKNKQLIDVDYIFELKKVFEDDDVCPFFQKLLQKFIECKKIKDKKMLINLLYTANKKPENIEDKFGLIINLNFEKHIKRSNIKDYSP